MIDLRQQSEIAWRELPAALRGVHVCIIEVPRGSFVKPRAEGGVDYISPLPCPYNYGGFVELIGYDDDPLDCIILGKRQRIGSKVAVEVIGVVGLIDRGRSDHKLIARLATNEAVRPLSKQERLVLSLLFLVLTSAKRVLHWWRGEPGKVKYLGIRAQDFAPQHCGKTE